MYVVVTKNKEVSLCQKKLEALLEKPLPLKTRLSVGYQGGNLLVDGFHNNNFWFASELLKNEITPRYWNIFGLEVKMHGNNNIVVQINPPLAGLNARAAGLFAINSKGHHILFHRGSIGGGRKGIGKNAFLKWYKNTRIVKHDQVSFKAIFVADLDSEDGFKQLRNFVNKVEEFKNIATTNI